MPITVRVYESDSVAKKASKLLEEHGFRPDLTHHLSSAQGDPAQVIKAAVDAEVVPIDYVKVATGLLSEGKSILVVYPPFGSMILAERLMDEMKPITGIVFPMIRRNSAAPLSDFLGLRTLSKGFSFGEPKLRRNGTPFSDAMGFSQLSDNPTPFSSRFGFSLLSKPKENWTHSFGMPLLSKTDANRTHSFGFPLLSSNPTPLSSFLGWATLSKKTDDGDEGFPKLLNNPTPFSSFMRFPVLSNEAANNKEQEQMSKDPNG